MYELPELMHLRDQFNDTLSGKIVESALLENFPHK
jgi:hypothetical protein